MKREDRLGAAALVLLVGALLAGGASAAAPLGNAALQLAGAALAGWAIACGALSGPSRLRWPLAAGLLVALIQFIPLPPALWQALPSRSEVAQGFLLLGQPLPWLTLSLSPLRSLATLASLIPALGIALALRVAPCSWQRRSIVAVVAAALASVGLGLAQQFADTGYLYAITNRGLAPGFFANANHQSDFLLVAIAMLPGLLPQGLPRAPRRLALALGAMIVAILLGGLAANRSLACLAMAPPVVLATAAIVLPKARRALLVLAAISLPVIAIVAIAGPFANDLTGGSLVPGISRADFLTSGLAMLREHWPFGSGLGTFPTVYRLHEDPAQVTGVFVNHAHNDWLELLVETGILGAVLIATSLAALARLVWNTVRASPTAPIRLAACLALVVPLLHSLVDYPLRTAALSAIVALVIAILDHPANE